MHLSAWFGDGSVGALLDELAAFQSRDGGFGRALEPCPPARRVVAVHTSVAFQYVTPTSMDRRSVRGPWSVLR